VPLRDVRAREPDNANQAADGYGRPGTPVPGARPLRAPGVAGAPAGAGRGEPADARAEQAGRLAAAGTRLHGEEDRLQAEPAYGEVDLGAQERLAGQAQAHRAARRRFRTGRQRPAA
jgi:hypothetical protein